jgi:GNAT superfamily N-acetyltransferase
MKNKISIASSEREITNCFVVMKELRTHLELPEFIDRVTRQQQQFGYRLAYLETENAIVAVAGFRISENLAWGKFLYIDDLVSKTDARSCGYGAELFEWLVVQARTEKCHQLHLDSGVQRFAAHRFYLRQRMEISSHHLSLKLS